MLQEARSNLCVSAACFRLLPCVRARVRACVLDALNTYTYLIYILK